MSEAMSTSMGTTLSTSVGADTGSLSSKRPPVVPTAKRRISVFNIGLGIHSILVFAFLFLPIVFVIAHAFAPAKAFILWGKGGPTTKWFEKLWENKPVRDVVRNSLFAAVGSTVLSVLIGGLAGIALARSAGKWSKPFMAMVFLILVTPEIIDAVALLIWFVRLGDYPGLGFFGNGWVRLFIGHSLFSSAVTTLIVRARLQGQDDSLEQAAADLGATPLRAFLSVTLPQITPALLSGGMLSFTFSLDNVIISNFVAGTSTFPSYLFANRSGLNPGLAAGGVVLVAITLLAGVSVALVLKRGGQSGSQIAAGLTGN
jgi:putrescine transport system permease protein